MTTPVEHPKGKGLIHAIVELCGRVVKEGGDRDLVAFLSSSKKDAFFAEFEQFLTVCDPSYSNPTSDPTINGPGFSVVVKFRAIVPADALWVVARKDAIE